MEKEVLECILKNRWNENAVQKIMSVETSPAVEKFRNFLSTVSRLKLRVILGSGRTATRYLITKESHVEDAMGQLMIDETNPFKTEIMMFEKVLKEMEYLMAEFDDTEEVLWANMIHCVPNKTIVLEDLKPKGFEMVNKAFFFDLDHGLMAVHSLGKFHAMSKVLEERGIVSKDGFKPWYAFNNMQMLQFGYMAFRNTLEGIKLHWGPRWADLAARVDLTQENLAMRLKALGDIELTFNVVCHGDCNKNNIMFKYDWNKRPTAVKFIDYQLSFYGSPCCDLNNIMYFCVHPSVRRANFDLFMKTYHDSLCSYLDRYNFKGSKPSLEDIMEGMEAYSFLGHWIFISFCGTLSLGDEVEKYLDFQKIMATGGQEGCNLDLFKLESVIEDLSPDFETFVNKFY